jgi:hypothetical protein
MMFGADSAGAAGSTKVLYLRTYGATQTAVGFSFSSTTPPPVGSQLVVTARLLNRIAQFGMPRPLITKTGAGVATVTTPDPFSSLEVHRIDRSSWKATPAKPGVYLLYGFVEDVPAVYIGTSTTPRRVRAENSVRPRIPG